MLVSEKGREGGRGKSGGLQMWLRVEAPWLLGKLENIDRN